MSSVAERQKTFRERRKAEKAQGLERAAFMLTKETTTRIHALAGFYELKPEQVIARAIETMWQERYDSQPLTVSEPRQPKIADDLAPKANSPKTRRRPSLPLLDGREGADSSVLSPVIDGADDTPSSIDIRGGKKPLNNTES